MGGNLSTATLVLGDGGESSLTIEMAALEAAGSQGAAIQPDPAARAAMGFNALDPSAQAPAARAGRDQGRREAARLRWLES